MPQVTQTHAVSPTILRLSTILADHLADLSKEEK
jgi:hypothetical protein